MSLLMSLLFAAAPDAVLLEKAGARAAALEAFVRHSVVTLELRGQEFDGAGAVTQRSLAVVALTRNGNQRSRVLSRYEENGKDLTEKKRRELEQQRDDAEQPSPFLPAEQARYRFTQLPAAEGQPGLVRVGFTPAGERHEKVMEGEAVLDPTTGELVHLTMQPSKLPAFVESLSIEGRFDAVTPAGRAMSSLTMKGVAGALFFKKRFTVETRFVNWAARPAPTSVDSGAAR